MPRWDRIISAAARPSRVRARGRAERGLLRGRGGERNASATHRGGSTCGIIVYFRGRGRTTAHPRALSGTAWPQCADRWRIAWNERASGFAPRSGSAKSRPERAWQSKALASSQASAAFANALLAAISSLALEQLPALAKAFIWSTRSMTVPRKPRGAFAETPTSWARRFRVRVLR
jgi:hypothetical protein